MAEFVDSMYERSYMVFMDYIENYNEKTEKNE